MTAAVGGRSVVRQTSEAGHDVEGRGVLVVGYGNALRTDDGLGWHAAARLADDPRLAGATVLQRHQLTPDLALEIGRATFVVFVDAGHGPPGSLSIQSVAAAPTATLTWSHHVSPAVLLTLARDLYGRVPGAATVSVGVESIEAGDVLTPLLEAALARVVDAVVGVVAAASDRRDPNAGGTVAEGSLPVAPAGARDA